MTRIITISVAICLILFPYQAFADEIILIVNEKGRLVNLTDKDIQDIYTGNKTIIEGFPIIVLEPKDKAAKELFVTTLLMMDLRDYRLNWTRKVFNDGSEPPHSKDQQEIVDTVKKEWTAIGYVYKGQHKDLSGVKIIRTLK